MRMASTSKAFSGAVVLALVDKGMLSLDDTIGQRLPALPAAWGAVTLRQLLDHTSGLPDFTEDKAFLATLRRDPHMVFLPHARSLTFVENDPLHSRRLAVPLLEQRQHRRRADGRAGDGPAL